MRLLKQIERFFILLLLKLTPAGRKELYYEKALKNLQETHVLSTLERRMLRSEIRYFISTTLKRKKISGHQMGLLVENKFKERLNGSGLRYNAMTFGVVDMIERRQKRTLEKTSKSA